LNFYFNFLAALLELIGMRQSCNFVNVYTKSCKRSVNIYMIMAANNNNQMAFGYDNSIIVNSDHQPPIMSARQSFK